MHVSLIPGAPELNAVLQVVFHKSLVGDTHLPWLADHIVFDQARIRLSLRTASSHWWFIVVTSTTRFFPTGLLLIHSLSSLYSCLGLPQPRCRTLHLALLNHVFSWVPPLKSVKVPLDFIPSLQHVSCNSVIHELAESALSLTVCAIDKDVKLQYQYWPLRHTTHHWSPLGHQATDYKSLSVTTQPVSYSLSDPYIKLMYLQFGDKDVMQGSVKYFVQVQVNHKPWSEYREK